MKEIVRTEQEIRFVKETFERELSSRLNLSKVSSPLIVDESTGINDDLNGIEKPVAFSIRGMNGNRATVVQSLAKWKRLRLKELGIAEGEGIITDMRALRPDECLSPFHSVYVDQWDWEKHIAVSERTLECLRSAVRLIYSALLKAETMVCEEITGLPPSLPQEIKFIHAEEMARQYPSLSPKEREEVVAGKYGAVFITGIGAVLSDGRRHDGRAPDYDDWTTINEDGYKGLNGDIIVWNPVLECAFELSSMGIRVDSRSLMLQLNECGCGERLSLPFHSMLAAGELPQSIGGGIGQSRVCMFMLRKSHIGQVQVSVWPENERLRLAGMGIELM
ncbi:MAG: aspartate--ammonia ligase [Bacteroidales bacterium]